MMKNYYKIVFVSLFSLLGCEQLIKIDPPKTQIDAGVVFESDETATAATLRIYRQFNEVTYGFTGMILGNISSDEFEGVPSNYQAVNLHEIPVDFIIIRNNLWYPYYQNIYRANAVIEGLTNNNMVTAELSRQLIAEAKAMRAYTYFYLVNFFGGVPLVTTTDIETNLNLVRSEVSEVWSQIESDITDAVADLRPEYQSAERARINKATGYALLSRVKLYLGKWQEAVAAATQVINNPAYILEPDLTNVFLKDSRETIWQGWIENGHTSIASNFIPLNSVSIPAFILSQQTIGIFSENDNRQDIWVGTNNINDEDYSYPAKYKRRNNSSTLPIEYLIVLRLAEQYLIRAEARAQLNKIDDAAADLNVVRLRAGTGTIQEELLSINQTNLLIAIEEERLRELFGEGSHRWFDLKRTGRINEVMLKAKGEIWESTDALYPIPLADRLSNPKLSQNDGYDE